MELILALFKMDKLLEKGYSNGMIKLYIKGHLKMEFHMDKVLLKCHKEKL